MHSFRKGLAVLGAALLVGWAGPAVANPVLTGSVTADNFFFAYISTSPTSLGTLIGSGNNWSTATSLTPTTLIPGTTYYLNIEAINGDSGTYSAGGLLGAFSLTAGATFANGSQTELTGGTGWTASYNDSNNQPVAQSWVEPTGAIVVLGANGVGPWGTVGGISGAADWIWAANANGGTASPGDQCAACTVDFQLQITTQSVPEPSGGALLLAGAAGLAWRRRRTLRPA